MKRYFDFSVAYEAENGGIEEFRCQSRTAQDAVNFARTYIGERRIVEVMKSVENWK